MGEIAELRRRWTVLYREAQERGDLYAASNLTTFYATIIKLAADERPEIGGRARGVPGARGGRPLNLQHTSAFDSLMHIDLYRGDVTRAWARLGAIWPEYARSLLFRVQLIRIQMLELRARTAVAAAERSQQPEPLLAHAERDARQLEREGQAWAVAHAHYVRAAIAACREDAVARRARSSPRRGTLRPRRHGAERPAHALPPRRDRQTDEPARELRDRAEDWLQEQGIVAPVAMGRDVRARIRPDQQRDDRDELLNDLGTPSARGSGPIGRIASGAGLQDVQAVRTFVARIRPAMCKSLQMIDASSELPGFADDRRKKA